MLFDLPKPLTVVAHDAGGANQIIAMLQANGGSAGIQAYMEGPALKLWERAFPAHTRSRALENAFEGGRSLLTGTGWQSNLEYEAIKLAKELSIPSAALLDHWVNYEERFIRDNHQQWPREFWVVDRYAFDKALTAFPRDRVKLRPDYYMKNQLNQISRISRESATLLYLSEPARSDWGRETQGEWQSLEYMLKSISRKGFPKVEKIRLRPHPSEENTKYDLWIRSRQDKRIVLDDSNSLHEAISMSSWVVGCESYALTVALAAKRKVYCTLPPWAPLCRLPHEGIEQFRSSKTNS